MNVVLLERSECSETGRAQITDGRARHITRVLKAVPGQTIRIGIVDGPLGQGTVLEVHDDAVILSCMFEASTPPQPRVDVLLALPRPKVLRRLWAQLAAIGVRQIILTNAARVERNYFDTHVLDPSVYRPLLLEGLQQARDTRLPAVSIHRQFRPLVEDTLEELFPRGKRIVASPGAPRSVGAVLADVGAAPVLVAIGPEGGWNAFEMELLESRRFVAVGMGARALRTDTATVAILALVHAALNEP